MSLEFLPSENYFLYNKNSWVMKFRNFLFMLKVTFQLWNLKNTFYFRIVLFKNLLDYKIWK